LPLGAPAIFIEKNKQKHFFLDNDAGKMVSKSVYYSNVREEHKAIKVAELYCLPGIVMLKKTYGRYTSTPVLRPLEPAAPALDAGLAALP
jgi:hypothetical protein